jgi:hypothetical protein
MKPLPRKDLLRIIFWSSVFFVPLLLLLAFYAEEDWRGARDWAACQRDLTAKGEILDLRQLVPPGKPEDDLSKAPIFAELYQGYEASLKKEAASSVTPRIKSIHTSIKSTPLTPKFGSYFAGESTDLAAWQKYYRSSPESRLPSKVGTSAQDVLQSLSRFDSDLNEIDMAVSRPGAFWPCNYEFPPATYLGGIWSTLAIQEVVGLRGIAHLDNHQADLAEKDYLFSFRLNRPISKTYDTSGYMITASNRTTANSILWEGLRQHAWNTVQLFEMESALASEHWLINLRSSLQCGRADFLGIPWLGTIKGESAVSILIRDTADTQNDIGYIDLFYPYYPLRPNGWIHEDLCHYTLAVENKINAVDLHRDTLDPTFFNSAKDVSRVHNWNEALLTPLTSISLPWLDRLGETATKAETYQRLARLACRLEEYRITHDQYPEKLDQLPDLPARLNQEVLSEQPLHYQRKADSYQLYSIGWNQKDNGGVYSATTDQPGDWPWPSP